jgi:L-methionine (R)-S-oxide reductase
MSAAEQVLQYCARAALAPSLLAPANRLQQLNDELRHAIAAAPPPSDLSKLYRYSIPLVSVDGSCSIQGRLQPEPFDLAKVLPGSVCPANTALLQTLHAVLDKVVGLTGVGWIGVYQVVPRSSLSSASGEHAPVLLKLAYRGKPSRPEFPLTPEFAQHSNNSAVALSGKARLLSSVSAHTQAGGAYYCCDPAVQSEACLPLLNASGEVVGLLDAEDEREGFFSRHGAANAPAAEVLSALLVLCVLLPELLRNHPIAPRIPLSSGHVSSSREGHLM